MTEYRGRNRAERRGPKGADACPGLPAEDEFPALTCNAYKLPWLSFCSRCRDERNYRRAMSIHRLRERDVERIRKSS